MQKSGLGQLQLEVIFSEQWSIQKMAWHSRGVTQKWSHLQAEVLEQEEPEDASSRGKAWCRRKERQQVKSLRLGTVI